MRIAAALLCIWFGYASANAEEAPLTFGAVPQQSSSKTHRAWAPVIAAFAQELGRPVELKVVADIPTFEACLSRGAFDIAYMNPLHYVFFRDRVGYAALAHRSGSGLKGLLVVRKDREIDEVAQLDGSVVAFPSKGAFGASVLIRAELAGRGVRFRPVYAKSHESTFRAVFVGAVEGGGGVGRTLARAPQDVRRELKVLYVTKSYTPHAIAALRTLGAEERAAISAALIAVSEKHPEALSNLGIGGLEAPGVGAYEDVAALGVSAEDAGLEDVEARACPFD